MNVFENLIAPIIILGMFLFAVGWFAVCVSKVGQPNRQFMAIVLKATAVPSILRVGCLWCMFAGVFQDRSGTWDFLLLMIGFYPEGVLLPQEFFTSPKDGRWTVLGTMFLSFLLTFTVFVCAAISAAIIASIRRNRGVVAAD